MAKRLKKVHKGECSNPEAEERNRLKKLAHSKNLLSETPTKSFTLLISSRTVLKHHGKDILKKSQRKNRSRYRDFLPPFLAAKLVSSLIWAPKTLFFILIFLRGG
ncbi:hypothetical protein Ancab_012699 [Ancistrocladus abbreviatus]